MTKNVIQIYLPRDGGHVVVQIKIYMTIMITVFDS